MTTSLVLASSPLALLVENRISRFDLPFVFEAQWDDLAMHPHMMLGLPESCETVAYFLRSILDDRESKDDIAGLRRVVFTAGFAWDVQYDKWCLSIQIPDSPSVSTEQSELYALLKSKI